MGLVDNRDDSALINLWIDDKFLNIISIMKSRIEEVGLGAKVRIEDDIIYALILRNGEQVGTIDVTKMLNDMATNEYGEYDTNLADGFYESAKVGRIIGERVRAAEALFLGSGSDVIDRISRLSSKNDIRYVVVSRE